MLQNVDCVDFIELNAFAPDYDRNVLVYSLAYITKKGASIYFQPIIKVGIDSNDVAFKGIED